MVIKRTIYEENSKNQRSSSVEVVKSGKEILENLVTASMVSKAMGTLKKEDISLLSIVYMDVGKELNLTPLYGESGPISDFISEGKKHIPKEFQESAISILELLIGKPYSINSANIYFTDANQVFSISGFSKPFSRILYRLK